MIYVYYKTCTVLANVLEIFFYFFYLFLYCIFTVYSRYLRRVISKRDGFTSKRHELIANQTIHVNEFLELFDCPSYNPCLKKMSSKENKIGKKERRRNKVEGRKIA
jgi:hypothetical protein